MTEHDRIVIGGGAAGPGAARRIRELVAKIAATEDAAALLREGIEVALGRARL